MILWYSGTWASFQEPIGREQMSSEGHKAMLSQPGHPGAWRLPMTSLLSTHENIWDERSKLNFKGAGWKGSIGFPSPPPTLHGCHLLSSHFLTSLNLLKWRWRDSVKKHQLCYLHCCWGWGNWKKLFLDAVKFSSGWPWGMLQASWGQVLMFWLLCGYKRRKMAWTTGLEGVHLKPQGLYIRDYSEFIDETGKLIILQSVRFRWVHKCQELTLFLSILFSTEFKDHERHLEWHLEDVSEPAATVLGVGQSARGTGCCRNSWMLSPICWLSWLAWGSFQACWLSSFSFSQP